MVTKTNIGIGSSVGIAAIMTIIFFGVNVDVTENSHWCEANPELGIIEYNESINRFSGTMITFYPDKDSRKGYKRCSSKWTNDFTDFEVYVPEAEQPIYNDNPRYNSGCLVDICTPGEEVCKCKN